MNIMISSFILIIHLAGFTSIQTDSTFECFVTRKAIKAFLEGDPVRVRASAYIKMGTTPGRDKIKSTDPISVALRNDGSGKVMNRYISQSSDEKSYIVVEAELFKASETQQVFETSLRDVDFPSDTKILYYIEEENRDLPPASPACFPKSEKDFQKWRQVRLKMEKPPMPLIYAKLIYTGGSMAFLFHPPILFYLGRRWKWKIPIPLICVMSIFAGWFLIINFLICQDIYLESAIHNGATELIHFHHADGARNLAAAMFGWMYSSILLIIWAPIILVGKFIYNKLKNKSCNIALSTNQ